MRKLVLVLLAACGGGGGGSAPDARVIDADGVHDQFGGADAMSGSIDVTVRSRDFDDSLVAGATIVVVGADGTVGATATTDGNGEASVTASWGDSVTAVYPDNGGVVMIATMDDVAPGVPITFGFGPATGNLGDPGGTMTLTWTAENGIVHWDVATPCGTQTVGAPTVDFTQYASCSASPFDVEVIGYDGAGTPTRYAIETGVAFANGATHAITAAFQDVVPWTIDLAGLQGASNLSAAMRSIQGTQIGITDYANGAPTGDAYSTTITHVPGADGTLAQIDAFDAANHWQEKVTPLPRTATGDTDPGVLALPWITTPTFDVASHSASWTATGTGTPDYGFVELQWSRPPTDYVWRVIGPVHGTSFTFPDLGGALSAYLPTASDTVQFDDEAMIATPGGWSARLRPEWVIVCPDCLPADRVVTSVAYSRPYSP